MFLSKTSTEPQNQTQNHPAKYRIDHKSIHQPGFILPQVKRVNVAKKPIRLEKESDYECEAVESSLLPGSCVYLPHPTKVLPQALSLRHLYNRNFRGDYMYT